ncbi:MAG: dihydrofolate reductase [Anaerolineae bacterium]|nr:dihydrofolate reductase [Anaerolineae bacterium]
MRKLVVTEFMTLDGIIENPGWSMGYWNDDIAKFKGEETGASDIMLLGRVTYDGFAQAWPQSKDQGAAYFNSVRKYVVSNTLKTADWNNTTIISGDVVGEIKKIKQDGDQDILVHGSATLIQSLIQNDLVDRFRLLVYPVVLGTGKRLFQEGTTTTLKLVEVRPIGSGGVTAFIYETERK